MTSPNEIWSADFKGESKTRDGVYCYPLTISDGYSCLIIVDSVSTPEVGVLNRD